MFSWIPAFLDWFGRATVVRDLLNSEFFKTIVLPVAYAISTAWAGFSQGVPVMWIMMAGALAFFGIVAGIMQLHKLRYHRTAESKLRFGSLQFGITTAHDTDKKKIQTGKPYVGAIRVGLSLNSIAHFPIAVIVEEVNTRLDGQYAKEKIAQEIRLTIDSAGTGTVNDVAVPIDRSKAIKGLELLEGDFDYKLKYGKSFKKCNHTLSGKFKISVYLNPRPQMPICEFHNA